MTRSPSSAGAAPCDDVPWLDADERRTWLALLRLTIALPASLDSQLNRDADLSLFAYSILASLSEQPDGTLPMTRLAAMANGSLSRLSHTTKRLELRGYVDRWPLPSDGRITVASITAAGRSAIESAAPAHVRHVRRVVFDALDQVDRDRLVQIATKIVEVLDADR